MITRKGIAFAAIALAFFLGHSVSEAAQRRNQDRIEEEQAPAVVIGPMAQSEAELEAFLAVQNEQSPAAKIALADTFLTTYQDSELTGWIQRFRMESFSALGRFEEAITAGEAGLDFEIKYMEALIARADAEAAAADTPNRDASTAPPLDKNSPEFRQFADETEAAMMFYYQSMMNAAQQLNDAPRTIEYAERALGQDPDDLFTVLTLSNVLAERPPAEEDRKEAHFQRAEQLGKQALTLVNGLQIDAAQKSALLSTAHATLGLIYLHQNKYGDSQREYLSSIDNKKDDPISYFRLGVAYVQDNKIDEALEALAKSVYLKGITEEQAREFLTEIYQAKHQSLDGLEQFIQSSGQKIGL